MPKKQQQQQQLEALTAFCSQRPDLTLLAQGLQTLGFQLTMHLPEKVYRAYTHLPAAPAQYHYQHPDGTEVIYLDGPDTEDDNAPSHIARFWLYQGHAPQTVQQVMNLTSCHFGLSWHISQEPETAATAQIQHAS